MAAIEIGRMAVKIAGRDAGKACIIISVEDKNFVLIDGNTRRKRCNIDHLELLPGKADIKKGASHEEVMKALESAGIEALPKSPAKPQKAKAAAPEKKEEKKGLLKRAAKPKAEKSKAEKA